ncbi:unnamed protein product [Oikopleura dioica]|uniref:SET domain-containing protein n=1 Tax=Oikopleura dioica TaxID=34765 RepID=E4XXP6_OIKDI|nr:unnamed protein product [Oikopleura dioica]
MYYFGTLPIVCQKTGLSYCSEECLKKADYNYMRLLIPNWEAVMEVEDLWRDMHFPPEEASIMLIMKMLAMRYLEPAMATKFETFVASEDNSEAHKLLGEKFETSKLLLTAGLQKIFEGLTEEEVSWAFLVCGRNQQGIGTSAITRWIQAHDDEEFIDKLYDTCEETCGLDFMDNEGVGLFSMQAMLNHGCEPNAEIKFKDDTDILSVEATRDIEKGEEVCIRKQAHHNSSLTFSVQKLFLFCFNNFSSSSFTTDPTSGLALSSPLLEDVFARGHPSQTSSRFARRAQRQTERDLPKGTRQKPPRPTPVL